MIDTSHGHPAPRNLPAIEDGEENMFKEKPMRELEVPPIANSNPQAVEVLNCVASSVPKKARESRSVTKLKGLENKRVEEYQSNS
jgi:hypothetical protein